jgi:hypothetical protein
VNPDRKVISRFRLTLAAVLSLWCAGAGCLLVSYARAAAITDAERSDSKGQGVTTRSSMGHSCHGARQEPPRRHSTTNRKTRNQSSALPMGPAPADTISCCPLTSGSFVVQSRSNSTEDEASSLNQSETLPFGVSISESTFRAIPLRWPGHHKAYLRGCAFLI